jgi:prevent-host-death family protein
MDHKEKSVLATVGMFEAKTHFSELAKRVEAGEEITVTRRGAPVLMLVPASRDRDTNSIRSAFDRLRHDVKTNTKKPISSEEITSLKHEGHKY